MKKKKMIYVCASIAFMSLMGSCADEEHVDPTADRAGITSLTAYFTSGEYKDKAAKEWIISNSDQITDYVIPIPYYYPEESDNSTAEAMKAMKVVAKLENNCIIKPGLSVLDLTKKNEFTYTDPYGNTRHITISGQQTRSDKCGLKSFMVNGDLSGVIDEDEKTVSLVTAADLSEATAEVVLDPHATITPDPSVPHNLNDGFEFTVTADNGVDKAVYRVMKQIPPKVDVGYVVGSEKELFTPIDLTTLGISDFATTHPTLASVGKYVVLNLGNGTAPMYYLKATGTKVGDVNLGNAKATGAITSDKAGNMLICNLAASGEKLEIYKTNDVTRAPQKFISYDNNLGVTIGARLHVQGDLNGDAVITATPFNCQNAIRWVVKNGVVGQPQNMLFGSLAAWGDLDNVPKVAAVDSKGEKGAFVDYYADGACIMYYSADWSSTAGILDGNSWGHNPGAVDVTDFNNSRYLVLFKIGYWPTWGLPGNVFIYDASNPASISGTDAGSPALKYSVTVPDYCSGNLDGNRFADVLVTPSEDGYFMYVFYVSNTHLSFGGIQMNCIKK